MVVTFAPKGLTTVITELEQHHEQIDEASFVNDVLGFRVADLAVRELGRGMLMGEANNDPPKMAENFKALVKTWVFVAPK